jgi:hypothetical protein
MAVRIAPEIAMERLKGRESAPLHLASTHGLPYGHDHTAPTS